MAEIKLILVDREAGVCKAWAEAFRDLPAVEIVNGSFERLPAFDCMVSPANSFGLMDGGIDAAILNFFGEDLQERVQRRIIADYLGEQPVGTAFVVETGHPRHPFLAHAPTMRVPMAVDQSENAYLAMWAMLLAVRRHNQAGASQIETVACPGLATATGRMLHREAARQMAQAYAFFLQPPAAPAEIDWQWAAERHWRIRRRDAR
ncbi:MAG TPA: macro domain-containing protein [Herpetosiphonaceae bacterium]